MDSYKDDSLATALEALRPVPRPAFAAELDELVAAGFPRRAAAATPLARLRAWLRALPPRQLALSTGAAALAAIVIATAVVASNDPATDSSSLARLSPDEQSAPFRQNQAAAGADTPAAAPSQGSTEVQYGGALPTGGESPSYSTSGAGSAAAGSGPFAAKAVHRDVERSAQIVLGADPDEVGEDAAKVFDAVHAVNGIVLSSSVRGGAASGGGASFDLLIPAAKLGDALAAFSAIDAVVSRHEATDDITAPTVRGGELLRDSRARIDGLVAQLAAADSDSERAVAEAELRAERRHNAHLRSQLSALQRRANLSRVSLRIETDSGATSPDAGAGWGVDDALGDAGHILSIAVAVAVVGLAILAPFALIALLAWLANRARLRRARERALA
ncbi:MAG TPA: DUF4349 domain-containing protein [Solirubrobacterales bacterium]|jgi:hypothetical protein|nr:DUF4349 domain-containing protein [Solirubrobacterales bacterium]